MNTNEESIEKAFYSDGYKLGMQAVNSEEGEQNMFREIGKMYQAIDNLIESLTTYAEQNQQAVNCKMGCDWCCHQPVFALDYELNYLLDFIKKNLTDEISAIKKRAAQKNNKFKELNGENLLNAKHPCPLLKNGACLAYAARPMACRIYLSYRVKTCIHFFKKPEDKTNFPALFEFPIKSGRMMNEGFKAALKTKGIVSQEFRIEEKLL